MAILIVNNSIFTTGAKFIAHQTNCISKNALGLAKDIFNLYPYANTYVLRDRTCLSDPGTIDILGNGLEYRFVINMNAQYNPGSAYKNIDFDTCSDRRVWFFNCLMKISEIENLDSIAFPDHIGCGLGGGDWKWYFKQLVKFEEYVKHKAKVLIYKNE